MTEQKKGLSPLAWIGIGCGGLLLIGIVVVSVGGYFAVKTASDFIGDNPAAAAAEALVRINPELELVDSDREAGTITIREKATGKEVTVNYSQLERGELVFGDGQGEEVRIQGETPAEVELTAEEQQELEAAAKVQADRARERIARANPEAAVSIEKFDWEKGGFDSIMIAHFTLENDNPFAVKDIAIACRTMAGSDTVLSRPSATIYEVIPAKESKRFTKVNMGFMNAQSSRAGCDIASVRATD